ncbi:hypothetical protein [Dactylosporangium sp. CA-092794]|uniref:hypothetical protein n=1 Tax=Dactylosporangium sp. CA-092794 TaxID=3239929 RepID=UPI003D8DC0CF
MRRTLAIALAAGLLFLGGCGRARIHQPAAPAGSVPAPAVSVPAPAASKNKAGNPAQDDVDQLLDQAGQQLSNDAQPAEDED